MELSSPILAQDDGSNLPKIVFGLIFFAIWALSAFVSWMNKKQAEAKRQGAQARDRVLAQGSAAIQRKPPARPRIAEGIAQRFPDVLLPPAPPPLPHLHHRRPAVPAPAPKPARRVGKPQQRRVAPVLPLPPVLEVASSAPSYVNITQPTARAKPSTIDASAVRTWLTPATLRQQFILTEILRPPLAMRSDLHDHS